MSLGDKVKAARKELDLTQEEFSKLLQISRSYLGDIERGKVKGTFELINKISDVTGKPITYFADKDSDIPLKSYEILDKTIEMLMGTGEISKENGVTDWAKKILMEVLLKEIDYKLEQEDKNEK